MPASRDLPPLLGPHRTPTGTRFAVHAGHAERVELCLFDETPDGAGGERRVELTDRKHGVFSVEVPGVGPGQRYGYRVHGPWRPEEGLRHNPAKLLIDPYARGLVGEVTLRPEVYGHVVGADLIAEGELQDDRDSAPFVPRSVVLDDTFDWQGDPVPTERERRPWSDSVVWEAHVRGATRRHPGVPEELRGTYAGLASPAMLEHLTRIGVTTVELLPVHAFTSEPHLQPLGLTNYWGYNTLSFFAPHPAYAAANDPQGVLDEFKTMVRTLHQHGFEVLLDVVYNHTCEQGATGAMLSWRGLDNPGYYRLGERGSHLDVTGCGNTVDSTDPAGLRMILDSLRYWVTQCHVDGFRFDLAVALARNTSHDYDPRSPFLSALDTDPVLSRVKLVAEPWDIGMGGWRTGQFPPPWAEWNDRFRDSVRSFWLVDMAAPQHHGHGVRELATRLAGSQDLFWAHDRGPVAGVNYVASHDGFTTADLTAYEQKHNEANGEHNRDGHGDNLSFNHGVEGPTDDPDILARRRRSIRNLLATTLLATGVPMLCAGDEIGRTQQGNNNAYCQDNEIGWLDWQLEQWQEDLADTVGFLTGLRSRHRVFRQGSFFSDRPIKGDGLVDVLWFGRYGEPMTSESWEDPTCRVLQMLILGDDITGHSFLLVYQGKHDDDTVTLPPVEGERRYALIWDSGWERPRATPGTPGTPDAAAAEAPGQATAALSATAETTEPGSTVTVPAASLRIYHLV